MTIRILGFVRSCWQCTEPVTCISGLYPHTPELDYQGTLLTTQGPRIMLVARDLLLRIGRGDLAAPIARVYSKTEQAVVEAVRCPGCGATQGNFFVGEHTVEHVASAGIAGLDTLGLAPCRTAHWQDLVHDDSVAWMGPVPA